jgi:glucose-6-phosphate isomerase
MQLTQECNDNSRLLSCISKSGADLQTLKEAAVASQWGAAICVPRFVPVTNKPQKTTNIQKHPMAK